MSNRENAASAARPDMRAPLRPDDGRERKRKGDVDQFYVDLDRIPVGWSYEWKRVSTYGQPDASYEVAMAENGWTPVEASRHPEFMPAGWTGKSIDRGGMRLMERPMRLTLEAHAENQSETRRLVESNKEKLVEAPIGTGPRAVQHIKSEIVIPD